MIYISQGTYRVVLDDSASFAINPIRMGSSRTAVAGNVIRQVSTLHSSAAEAAYSGLVDNADASTLSTMHTASSSVTLHYRNKKYSALMTYEGRERKGSKTSVSLRFQIVRELT